MKQRKSHTYMSVGAVIFTAFNFAQAAVREIQLFCFMVNRESVWSEYICANDDFHVIPCKSRAHDTGALFVPIGPKHEAIKYIRQKMRGIDAIFQTALARQNDSILSPVGIFKPALWDCEISPTSQIVVDRKASGPV